MFLGALSWAVVVQGYGLTETTARVFGAVGPEETRVEGANGKLMPNIEAKIVEAASETGIGLPPLMQGEIWIRGPCIMKGNVGLYTSDIEGEGFEHSICSKLLELRAPHSNVLVMLIC